MSWINRLLSSVPGRGTQDPATSEIAPDEPFFAIGDIHGQFDALDALLAKIEGLSVVQPVVCVGDYIDRGEHSAHVLTWLKHLTELYPELFICLKGNHELMCLNFIDDPEHQGERWLRNGGLQTLASFGIGRLPDDSLTGLRNHLVEEMGDEMIDWMRALPLLWRSGNVVACHAGADPAVGIEAQNERHLLWGHSDFARTQRGDGLWILHGHTIVDDPVVDAGRISIDTGAYATGRLTAAYVQVGTVEFLSS